MFNSFYIVLLELFKMQTDEHCLYVVKKLATGYVCQIKIK